MSENNNQNLKGINDFVADCAKSILINNVKAEEIKDKILKLNETIKDEIKNSNGKTNSQKDSIIAKVDESQKMICDLIRQTSSQNEKLIKDVLNKLSENTDVIKSLMKSEIDNLNKKNTNQHNELSSTISLKFEQLYNNIEKKFKFQDNFALEKSKFLPWITAGVYLTLAYLIFFR